MALTALDRAFEGFRYPTDFLKETHQDGVTEGWIAQAVYSLLIASGGIRVVELGGFTGVTSAWLAIALDQMGGGHLLVSEPDTARAQTIKARIGELAMRKVLDIEKVRIEVSQVPSPQIIYELEDRSIDFAFVDNDHTKIHVEQEINALWPKMSPGGIMCFHDIDGPCDLQTVVRKYGGIALHLPKLGPSGGLGIIQIPTGSP